MNIFLDESGSFVDAAKMNSWNSIVAYMAPEVDRRGMRAALKRLKRAAGVAGVNEVKLHQISEPAYFQFLADLNPLSGILFSVATDAGVNNLEDVKGHQNGQADKISEHRDKLKFESARQGIDELADRVRGLAPQLYVQLHCQLNLISMILHSGILYFVQRFPQSLGRFRWRIDQKNSKQTIFEKTFVNLLPPILQTISLREPMPMLEGADYRAFERYEYPEGEAPTYLKDTYGIETRDDVKTDIGKLIREDLKFEDSRASQGVQVADLLASGVRRCLRGEFDDNSRAARFLGRLMLTRLKDDSPIWLLGFSNEERRVEENVAARIHSMRRYCRQMVVD